MYERLESAVRGERTEEALARAAAEPFRVMEEELARQNLQMVLWRESLQKERLEHRQLQARLSLPSGVADPASGADRSGGVVGLAGVDASRSALVGLIAGSSGAAVAGGGKTSAMA